MEALAECLWPPTCAQCGCRIDKTERFAALCPRCSLKIPWRLPHEQFLPLLTVQAASALPEEARELLEGQTCFVACHYAPDLARMLRQLKFNEKEAWGLLLGEWLAYAAARQAGFREGLWQVLAVPLSPQRQKERGYNQSHFLAQTLGLKLGIKCNEQVLYRTQDTERQTETKASSRRQTLLDAFAADPSACLGQRFLLVDDVLSSGMTLAAATLALIQAGAAQVQALALASGRKQ